MHATIPLLIKTRFPSLLRRNVEILQVNLGYRCNQSCVHCHVNAGPKRTEEMNSETIDSLIDFISTSADVKVLDLTGGAPEMNPNFRALVVNARARGLKVIDRCNLTILEEPGFESAAQFLADHHVEIVASLPCYLEENVDKQRGKGTFAASIKGLKRLNTLGYGKPESDLVLNLVYNPQGPSLPPPQEPLQTAYKAHLSKEFGIVFNNLYTLANMPIQRFGSMLISKGQFNSYMQLLHESHRNKNLEHVMCRNLLSVDWQGYVYDCDFNQQLGLAITGESRSRLHISEITGAMLEGHPIRIADHCYGCTAGQGSSCGGALGTESVAAPSCGA